MSVRAHAGVKDEVPDDLDPAGVVGQVVVVLGRQLLDLGQLVVGDVGEVVVLVVVANVVQDEVEGPVVGVGGLALGEDIVLGDKVAGQRVKAQRHQRARNHVDNWLDTPKLEDDEIKCKLRGSVYGLPSSQGLGGLVKWPDGVQDGVQQQPDGLGGRVTEQPCLQPRGDVHVLHLLPQVPVVVRMVLFVCNGHGHTKWQVDPQAEHSVHPRPLPMPKGKVVTNLVYC